MNTMTIPAWTLQDRLRKAREHAHLSQTALAEKIPVARNTIGRWETGSFSPSESDLRRIAELTGVDAQWLIEGAQDGAEGVGVPQRIVLDFHGGKYSITEQSSN